MDAVEFLDKIDRLSQIGSTGEKIRYTDYRTAGDNVGAVKFVKQWTAAHPVKTRQSEFLKMFPGADVGETDGCLTLCPCNIYEKMRKECGAPKCSECRKEFWFTEVEE